MVQSIFIMFLKGKIQITQGQDAALPYSMAKEPGTLPSGCLGAQCGIHKSRLPGRGSLRRVFGEIPPEVREPDKKKKAELFLLFL